jgi:cell division protein FtsW (lipid II flippase)
MKILAVILCLIGCVLLYCSHQHQKLLKQKLAKQAVYIGLSLVIVSLILLFISVPKLVAAYMWSMTMLVMWSLLPFIALFKKNISNEISDSTKNPS